MAKDRNGALPDERANTEKTENHDEEEGSGAPPRRKSGIARENSGSDSEEDRKGSSKSRRKARESSDSEGEEESGRKRGKSERRKRKSRRRYSSEEDSGSDSEESDSESEGSGSGSDVDSESESERRRSRKRKEKKRRREREEEEDEKERKRRRREKEKKRRRRDREEERKKKEKRKKKKKERGKKGAVTNLWGKYGIIRETDMWTKRPEFTAWLAEVKQVNLETLPNWEEKQMFKQFMEDHNTATFPSKKYYDLDAYHMRKLEKEVEKGFKKVMGKERTVFNDEEQRRQELLREREKHKEEQVETLKRSMQSGMAQAMKEQAQLREEMAYQYKLGNFEAAAAIQRRLDPDVAM